MTPEADLLLSTLRGSETRAPASIDWHSLLELAASHGVLPLVCRDYRGTLPESFKSRARSERATSAFLASELEFSPPDTFACADWKYCRSKVRCSRKLSTAAQV
jgi:hypothetical protein